ncbi:MAG: DUF3887 domain-containing protein [Clostridiaceae bacterium]|nr:DUF3887 domain-containing protein [Clostridiaceae bacterium]
MKKTVLNILLFLTLIFSLTGCTSSVEYDSVKNYADNITSEVLTSINNLDYDSFSSYLSDEMKASYDLGTFQKETIQIGNDFGSFKSLSFYGGQEKSGYVNLIYDVVYSNCDDVRISISFKKDDSEHKVYQLYFASLD